MPRIAGVLSTRLSASLPLQVEMMEDNERARILHVYHHSRHRQHRTVRLIAKKANFKISETVLFARED